MNKIIAYLIFLIVLAIAGEGGYYLGVNTGKRIGIQDTLKNQGEQTNQKRNPIAVIPIINKSAIQWVQQINSFPTDFLWKSVWNVIIGAELESIDDNSVTLKMKNSTEKLTFPTSINEAKTIKFSQYDQKEKKYLPNSLVRDDFKQGDFISINISVETLKGNIEFFELTKQLNRIP